MNDYITDMAEAARGNIGATLLFYRIEDAQWTYGVYGKIISASDSTVTIEMDDMLLTVKNYVSVRYMR